MASDKRTVRVRIAVVMNADGEWGCAASYNGDDNGAWSVAGENLSTDPGEVMEALHFIEADVPVPASTTIEGAVTTPNTETASDD